MILILTMAGQYQRFKEKGFNIPKYLLPWGERTVLSELLNQFNTNKDFTQIFLIANLRDQVYMPHVHSIMRSNEINSENLLLIGDTKGQAETAMIGLKLIEKMLGNTTMPIIFHNIDTILYARDWQQIQSKLQDHDAYIDVFKSNAKDYSYVLLNENGNVKAISEKIVVSDLATSGLYGFKNSKIFKKNFKTDQTNYISSIYENMISNNLNIAVSNVHHEDDTVVLGTPEEYFNASLVCLH